MLRRLGDVKRGDLLGRWEAELGPESGSTRPLPNGWPGPRLGAAGGVERNSGTPVRGKQPGRSQSFHSSEEAG